jgi:hypothetical protein
LWWPDQTRGEAAGWNSSRAPEAAQSQPLKAVVGLQVGKAHFDALAIAAQTTRSKTWRNAPLSRQRPSRLAEKVE